MHASFHFCLISNFLRWIFLEVGEGHPWVPTRCPRCPFSRSASHGNLTSRFLNRAKLPFPKLCDPAFCLAPTSWDLELYHLIVITAKAAPNHHTLTSSSMFLYDIQQITSPCSSPTHFIQQIITIIFQEPSGLLVSSSVAPPQVPGDWGNPWEQISANMSSEEGLLYFFLIRQLIRHQP